MLDEQEISERDFIRLSRFIWDYLGIKMPPDKKAMLKGRIKKRMRALDLATYREYCDYLFSPEGMEDELVHLSSVVTTNKTDFFREPKSFDFLAGNVLPDFVLSKGIGVKRRLNIWSAGCSTGEEPYTMAMVLNQFTQKYPGINFNYVILATDISSKVLETAQRAVYDLDRIEPIPMELRHQYLLRSKDPSQKQVRITAPIRAKIVFRRLNLMEEFNIDYKMDIIFCRNVIIYFDQPTREKLFERFCQQLHPEGYLFLGHSENIIMANLPLTQAAPTIYQKIKS
ncbi:MAG: chemotaxis protein CheR [Deltaproteobacteria bacterium]|nr:chemotaxis protein CheR [Deltaproteobacteria bacterium]